MRLVMGRGLCSRLSFAAVRTTASLLLLALCSVLLLASTSGESSRSCIACGTAHNDAFLASLFPLPLLGSCRSAPFIPHQSRSSCSC
jgi:hypothetical protein